MDSTEAGCPLPPVSTRRPDMVLIAVGVLGMAAVITQLTLLRELLGAFSGNELVFGLALGCWLLLTGLGAAFGHVAHRRIALARSLAAGMLGVAWLPELQLLALRAGRDLLVPHGATAGLGSTILGCVIVLLPFCLLSGALLTLACARLEQAGEPAAIGRVYLADTAGSLVGGGLFSFVFVSRLDHFALLAVPALLALLMAGVVARHDGQPGLLAAVALSAVGLTGAALWGDIDARSTQWCHGGTVVYRATSPYGRLVVTHDADQLTFFENGRPILHTDNAAAVEEAALYALSQRPAPRHVLLVSGGVAGTAREILRHADTLVTCLELDPEVIAAGRKLVPQNFSHRWITMIATDGRRFLQRIAPGSFDLIIFDLPEPATLQINRFFTTECFAAAKRALVSGGVLSFGLGQYHNYVSADLARMLASAHRTLRENFQQVVLIPGGRVFFLASDAPLHLDIAARIPRGFQEPRWVNRNYLQATLAPDRLADLARAIDQPAASNRDFSPILYYYHLRYWLGQFTHPHSVPGILLLVALAVYLTRLAAMPRMIFAAGFAASGLEVVVLLAYQVFYGSLYQQVGLVVTVFMAGLALGAAGGNRRLFALPPNRAAALLGLALAALAAILPLLLPSLSGLDRTAGTDLAGQTAILLLTLLLAGIVGAQFSLAGMADSPLVQPKAGRLFAADLLGAALGAILVSAWLVPLFGVTTVCLLTAGLNALTAALAWRSLQA